MHPNQIAANVSNTLHIHRYSVEDVAAHTATAFSYPRYLAKLGGLFAIFWISLTMSAPAQTLPEAMQQAASYAPDLDIARLDAERVKAQIDDAVGAGRLQVNAEASVNWNKLDTNVPFNFNAGDTSTASTLLTATLPIYTGGATRARIKAAVSTSSAQNALLESTMQDIYYRTIEAYMGVWRDRMAEALALNATNLAKAQLTQARDNFEVGVLTQTDVALAEANLARNTANTESQSAQLAASEANFIYLTGLTPQAIEPPPKLLGVPADRELAIHALKRHNPNIKALIHQAEANKQAELVARSAYRPQISFSASASYGQEWRDTDYESQIGAGIGMSLPIYTGGIRRNALKQTQIETARHERLIDQTTRQLQVELVRLWSLRKANARVLEAARIQVAAQSQAYDGAKAEFEFGTRPWIDVLDAQQELLAARQAMINANHDYVLASAGLLALLNRLSPEISTLEPQEMWTDQVADTLDP